MSKRISPLAKIDPGTAGIIASGIVALAIIALAATQAGRIDQVMHRAIQSLQAAR